MLEQFIKTCSDLLCAGLCATTIETMELSSLRCDSSTQDALSLLVQLPEGFTCVDKTALWLSGQLSQLVVCPSLGDQGIPRTPGTPGAADVTASINSPGMLPNSIQA